MFKRLALTAIVLSLAACRADDREFLPSVTPAEDQRSTPTASPSPEPPFFTLAASEPVFHHGAEGTWHSSAVEPGSILFIDGTYHMYFNGFTGWPAKSAVGYATSSDGAHWTLPSDQPLLDSGLEVFDGFTFFVSSVVQVDPGTWMMYLYTLDEGRDGAPGAILRAEAGSPAGPWSLDPNFVLSPGEPGSWDASRVTQPHVIKVAEGYRMYFAGYENDRLQGPRRIGLALSTDGLTWEKLPEPVFLPNADIRAWDAHRVFQPRVLKTDEGYLMLYKANVSVGRAEGWGFAFSADGRQWSRYPGNPVIRPDTYEIALRRNGIGEMISTDEGLLLFLEILEREGGAYHHGNSAYRSNIFLFQGRTP